MHGNEKNVSRYEWNKKKNETKMRRTGDKLTLFSHRIHWIENCARDVKTSQNLNAFLCVSCSYHERNKRKNCLPLATGALHFMINFSCIETEKFIVLEEVSEVFVSFCRRLELWVENFSISSFSQMIVLTFQYFFSIFIFISCLWNHSYWVKYQQNKIQTQKHNWSSSESALARFYIV